MRRRTILAGTLAGLTLAAMAAVPSQAQQVTPNCPTPLAAQKLAAKAVSIERTVKDGREITRYNMAPGYVVPASMQSYGDINAVGLIAAETPHHTEASKDWYIRSNTWVERATSVPCSGPDGYAFGFLTRCYNSPAGTSSPKTIIACNWDVRAALQYDHGIHNDWDSAWGYREYHDQNQGSCTDTGTLHPLSDTAPGETRTLIYALGRFLALNYLTQPRKTASLHVKVSGFDIHGGGVPGTGSWVAAESFPGGSDDNC